ncbi:MAG: NAD(P)H-dependent oxidoreductase [Sandaracinaceae bacterium]|nr:NAD(P)H-dependent oxidoreductase [Sandaracinaceae bacterium]
MAAKILVVYSHPNPKSFSRAVLESVLAGLGRAECEVQLLDLYAEGFDPVLVVDEQRRRRDLHRVEYTQPYREQIAWCDAMVFVYPVWWGGFPAMLKGYLDRTFVSGLTYSFEGRPESAVFPHGLMRGREAHFFYTLDSPALVAFVDPGWLSNYFTVFRYCGFGPVRRYYLARLKRTTPEQRERWLARVSEHARAIGARLTRRREVAAVSTR